MLVGPKFAQRQAGVERKFQGRQRAALQKAGESPDTPLSTPEDRHVVLSPLVMVAGFGAALSWFLLWRSHFAKRPIKPTATSGGDRENAPPDNHSGDDRSPQPEPQQENAS